MSLENADINETFFNIDFILHIIENKNPGWQYEKEWRLWVLNNKQFHSYIGKLKANAIYLGEFIEEYDKIALIEIAKMKNIPVISNAIIYAKKQL